jgi:predicted permease
MIRAMNRLLFVLSISFGSIAVGYLIQRVVRSRAPGADQALLPPSRRLKIISFFVLNPIATVSTFWGMNMPDSRVFGVPLVGLASVLIGMAGAMMAIRILKLPPFRAGSVFTCGTFSNIITIGGLVAYTLFREPGYAMVQFFNLAAFPAYYLLGYPISGNIGLGRKPVFKVSGASFKENPYLILPLAATGVGFGLRYANVTRPEFFSGVVGFIVPCVAATLGIAIGLTLSFTSVRSYLKEISIILVIRHLLVPVLVIPAAVLLGLGEVADGLPLKVTIILACMPVGFSALVPPAIYGFDLNLANSAWIVSTALLVVIIPILFLIFRVAF